MVSDEMEENKQLKVFQNLHWLSLIIGGLSIILPLVFWSRIPEEIPMHYNAAGEVDNWENKTSLILLFFVIAMLMGLMSIVVYFVKINMQSQYSKEQEKTELRIVYPIVVLMNLSLQFMFAYITFCTVTARQLGNLFLPVVVVAISVLLVYMIYKCGRVRTISGGEKAIYQAVEKTQTGTVYRTAVDWWLGLLLGGCELWMIWIAIESIITAGKVSWSMLLITIGTSILIVPLFGIKYVLYEEHMLVSMNIYGKVRIRYNDISEAKKTNNPLSSAAMSLRRVQIDYTENGIHRMVLISPVRRKTFLRELEEKRENHSSS